MRETDIRNEPAFTSGEPESPDRAPDGQLPSGRRARSIADVRGEPPSGEPSTRVNETGFTGFSDIGAPDADAQSGRPRTDSDEQRAEGEEGGDTLADGIDFSAVASALGSLSSLGGLL